MEQLFSKAALNESKVSILKNGMGFALQALATGVALTNMTFIRSALLVIISFVTFDLLLGQRVRGDMFSSDIYIQRLLNGLFKVGFMLVMSRAIASGVDSLQDPAWQRSSLYTLVGFAVYDFGVSRVADNALAGADVRTGTALYTAARFSVMNIVARHLSGGDFDQDWMVSTGAFIAGLSLYDLVA